MGTKKGLPIATHTHTHLLRFLPPFLNILFIFFVYSTVLLELLFGKSGSSSNGRALPIRMVKYESLCKPEDAVSEILEEEKYVKCMMEQVTEI